MGTMIGPGLGKFTCLDLATCSISDLGTADAGDITSGTFGLARIPSIDNAHLAGGITSDKIPALSGTAIAYPINADTVGTTQIIAGGVANSELAASGLDISKFTIGTAGVDRIPVLPTSRYGSAVLVSGERSMEGTLSMGTHEIDHLKKVMFREEHDVAILTEGSYALSITNKAESAWANLKLGWLYPYGGVDMGGYPLQGVLTPTSGSHAPNKNYIDNHIWEANDITTGTFSEDRIPNLPTTKIISGTFGLARIPVMDDVRIPDLETLSYGAAFGTAQIPSLGAYKIASGTLNADRIPVLPTDRYGSAVLVDGSRAMEGTFNTGNHPIDDVKKIGFRDIHDVALITEGTHTLSLVSKDVSTGGTLKLNYIYPYAGIHWTISDKQAGADLSAGDSVYLKSDGKWWKTDADAEATTKGMLGLVMQTKTAGQTVRVLVFGRVTATGWSLTVGAPIYVSCTAGGLTQTAPSGSGDQVRKIGHALTSDTIIFNPDATIIEIA